MANEIFSFLKFKCPKCKAPFNHLKQVSDNIITCLLCGFNIRYINKAWDARVNCNYPSDFSIQWDLWSKGKFGDTQMVYRRRQEDDFRDLLAKIGLSISDLKNKKVLEVGFGHGRILQQFQRHSLIAVGVDLINPVSSVELKEGFTIRADLFNIPLMPYQFDIVICRGVIHHTRDVELAFERVVEQVSPGGIMYLYIYERIPKLRKLLPYCWMLPSLLRLILSHLLGYIRAVNYLFKERCFSVKLFRLYHGDYTLDTFDIISPRWVSMHSKEKVMNWFKSNGFTCEYKGGCSYIGIKNKRQVLSNVSG